MKICAIVFERLPSVVERGITSDPDLLEGRIPSDFMNKMANMEVLPWMQISDRVKQIEQMSKEILDLKARYDDVLEPIRKLTENVNRVTDDVKALAARTSEIATDLDRLSDVTSENAKQLSQLASSVLTLTAEVRVVKDHAERAEAATERHEGTITKLTEKFSRFSFAVYVFWTVVIFLLGVFAPQLLDLLRADP